MGCIKANNYELEDVKTSLLGRAFAHPARVQIVKDLLKEPIGVTNIDLTRKLGFTKSTVKMHLDTLKDANILDFEYHIHFYLISLNAEGRQFAERIFQE